MSPSPIPQETGPWATCVQCGGEVTTVDLDQVFAVDTFVTPASVRTSPGYVAQPCGHRNGVRVTVSQ